MLRMRLATAAVALPALWLFIVHAPAWSFATFILVVTAIGLMEYFTMALPDHMPERVAGTIFGLVVAAGVATRDPHLWGAGGSLKGNGRLAFPPAPPADLGAAGPPARLPIL